MPACRDCAFLARVKYDGRPGGECRVNPPTALDASNWSGVWPWVLHHHWCGCFVPNNSADAPPPPPIPAERTDPWTDIGYTRPATANQKED